MGISGKDRYRDRRAREAAVRHCHTPKRALIKSNKYAEAGEVVQRVKSLLTNLRAEFNLRGPIRCEERTGSLKLSSDLHRHDMSNAHHLHIRTCTHTDNKNLFKREIVLRGDGSVCQVLCKQKKKKRLHVLAHPCNSALEGRDRVLYGVHWPAILPYLVSFRPLKQQVDGSQGDPLFMNP